MPGPIATWREVQRKKREAVHARVIALAKAKWWPSEIANVTGLKPRTINAVIHKARKAGEKIPRINAVEPREFVKLPAHVVAALEAEASRKGVPLNALASRIISGAIIKEEVSA